MSILGVFIFNCGFTTSGNTGTLRSSSASDDEILLNEVEQQTFKYFWDGAEATTGMARERYHIDDPNNDKTTITTGGSGFGIMAIIAGMERGYITRAQGFERMSKIVSFLENADVFHGAFPHWHVPSGKVKDFSEKDNGADLVETSFLMQGLLALHQYYINGSEAEKNLATRIDVLWKRVEWNWFCNNQNILYWHWSPDYEWEMNLPIGGYNECLITYLLAASSPTHSISKDIYQKGWADNGKIINSHKVENIQLKLKYGGTTIGPLFWAHYSFLGLDPRGLTDSYSTNYFDEMKNYTLANRAYCIRNPNSYTGYGTNCWGLTASYSVNGYSAHAPLKASDLGVISPTAALSSIVYTPEESMNVIRYLYNNKKDKVWGKFGFYDAFSETANWYPQRYLAIDQGPIVVMIENHRSQLLWNLFMSHPDVRNGLKKLGFSSPFITGSNHITADAKDILYQPSPREIVFTQEVDKVELYNTLGALIAVYNNSGNTLSIPDNVKGTAILHITLPDGMVKTKKVTLFRR